MRTVRAVAAAVVLVLVGGSSPWSPLTAGRRRGRGLLRSPPAGSCFDLTLRQTRAPSTREAPVDCSRHHTPAGHGGRAASRGAGLELAALGDHQGGHDDLPARAGPGSSAATGCSSTAPSTCGTFTPTNAQKSHGRALVRLHDRRRGGHQAHQPAAQPHAAQQPYARRHRPVRDGDLHSTTCADTHVALLRAFYARGRPTGARRGPPTGPARTSPVAVSSTPGWTSPVGATSWAATPRRRAAGPPVSPRQAARRRGRRATACMAAIAAADGVDRPGRPVGTSLSHAGSDPRAPGPLAEEEADAPRHRGGLQVGGRAGLSMPAPALVGRYASAGTSEWLPDRSVTIAPRQFQRRLDGWTSGVGGAHDRPRC